MDKILITGGAGFVGSNLAIKFRERVPSVSVVALDNLKRRGSELTLPRLRKHGVTFVHGDVRVKEDILGAGPADLIIDAAAEPSVLAGVNDSPHYVIDTNLTGTLNTLEAARRYGARIIFLSTSRVYPIETLNALAFSEDEHRFNLLPQQAIRGAGAHGISEDFPVEGARSLYGASKLCSELFLQEYLASYGLKGIINRCGVITGPWQMGKVDQGVVVLWVAKHLFGGELSFIGYGGGGKQVRDILHIDDLFTLLVEQLTHLERLSGQVFNVGGGPEVSVSLRELTTLCQEVTGKTIPISSIREDRPNDIRMYMSDTRKVSTALNWSAKRTPRQIIEDITSWIRAHQQSLQPILS